MNEYTWAVLLAAVVCIPGAWVLFSRHQSPKNAPVTDSAPAPRGAAGGEGVGCTMICVLLFVVGLGVCIASMAPE